jgi:putative ABC transport system permease protein
MRGGLMLALTGVAIGMGSAFALTRYMVSLIFGVSPFDPITFLTVTCLLIAVAALASYVPAIRAARIDAIQALRVE